MLTIRTGGWLGVLAITAIVPTHAWATDRYYNDLAVYLPSKTYRLEARSPDNASGSCQPFQSSFTYTLYNCDTGEALWQREQPMKKSEKGWAFPDGEASPVDAWVDDARRVVVRTGWDQIILFSPSDGSKLLQFELLDQFTKEDQTHVVDTTAGPMWCAYSRWYFLPGDAVKVSNGRDSSGAYFVIRTWWDRHMVVDLVAPGIVKTAESRNSDHLVPIKGPKLAALKTAIRNTEREWVLETLRKSPAHFNTDGVDCEQVFDVTTAVHMAGRMKIKEAIPLLRKLEGSQYVGSSTTCGGLGWEEYTLRQVAQLSLRRLGETPGDYPCILLDAEERGPERSKRVTGVRLVKEGMPLPDLVKAIGHPDYRASFGFEYDMDSDPPFTLRVVLEQVGDWQSTEYRVDKIIRIRPAVWLDGNRRDRDICN